LIDGVPLAVGEGAFPALPAVWRLQALHVLRRVLSHREVVISLHTPTPTPKDPHLPFTLMDILFCTAFFFHTGH
jgi:hypothetical protein